MYSREAIITVYTIGEDNDNSAMNVSVSKLLFFILLNNWPEEKTKLEKNYIWLNRTRWNVCLK